MKGVLIVLAVIALSGCTTRPSQHWIEYDPTLKEKIVINVQYPGNSALLIGDTKEVFWQRCPMTALDLAFDKLDESWCVTEHIHKDGMTYDVRTHDASQSVVKAVLPAVIMGGAIAGGGALIGNGLSKGGSTQNNTTTQQNQFIDNVQPGGGHAQKAK